MTDCCEALSPSRRAFFLGGSAMFAWAHLPRVASAAGARDPRFVVIVLRGAVDGLATVAPVGDPRYASLHGQIALSLSGDHAATPLDGFFALHPSMPALARMFKQGHATVVHATATGYRERSHFDGQDVLESGYAGPGRIDSGWLNRAIGVLPSAERINVRGLAVGPATPLILRGKVPVLGWAPRLARAAPEDLATRVLDLYAHRDPALNAALAQGLDTDRLAAREGMAGTVAARDRNAIMGMRLTAEGTAKLMAADDGPRVAALSFDGWDTHADEGGPIGRLAQLLGGLDAALEAFESSLGTRWKETSIIAITEFGRTARINGTVGTDHGTGTVALLAGGAVKGGRVIADWPGLRDGELFEGRDLKPTVDLRAVLKGMLAEQFDLSPFVLGKQIFPGSGDIKPLTGLLV